MAKVCFCGCGQKVPRLPLGLRSVNERGARVRDDVELLEGLLEGTAIESPSAEEFIAEGRQWMEQIAAGVHARSEPSPEVEAGTRDFMARGRNQFSEAGVGAAATSSGMDLEEFGEAMMRGEVDPFATG